MLELLAATAGHEERVRTTPPHPGTTRDDRPA
jgi:hypothetical protein